MAADLRLRTHEHYGRVLPRLHRWNEMSEKIFSLTVQATPKELRRLNIDFTCETQNNSRNNLNIPLCWNAALCQWIYAPQYFQVMYCPRLQETIGPGTCNSSSICLALKICKSSTLPRKVRIQLPSDVTSGHRKETESSSTR